MNESPRKIVVTGASGFLGRQLVPRLLKSNCDVLLIGRDTERLKSLFPNSDCCTYESITTVAKNFEIAIHLAVLNNDSQEDESEFQKINVDLLLNTVASCREAGIKNFVNVTTFHALDENKSFYSKSKRSAVNSLKYVTGINITNIFLPAVYGDEYSGKLSFMPKLPLFLRSLALKFLSAIHPAVHIDLVANALLRKNIGESQSLMLSNPQEENVFFQFFKKLIDLLFSISVLVILGWLMILVWGLVRLSSTGPSIFAQQRVGQYGRVFTCYKFRTMKLGTKQAGTHEISSDVITGIGAILRKTKIDELPQIWNILRGEMSLVGPRPCLPIQTELCSLRSKHGVLDVLPGITGLAQIKGIDMSNAEDLVRVDEQYIARRSLSLDCKIIIATILGSGQGDRVRA